MTPGNQTSEYRMARLWTWIAWSSIGACYAAAMVSWAGALAFAPVAIMTLYAASIIANNYCEDRYLLKKDNEEDDRKPCQERPTFGFSRFVTTEEGDQDDEQQDSSR